MSRFASIHLWLTATMLLPICGCSGRVSTAGVDPAAVARRAVEQYDKNGDGRITDAEFSPGLKALAKTADENKDGALTASEIANRLQAHVDSKIGLQDMGGQILLDNRPLPGATVTFLPDPVFNDVLEAASGVTDESGFVSVSIAGSSFPGMRPGFYRVEVSKKIGGREQIPARYNTQSELGEEVGPNASRGGWNLALSSR